MKIAGIVTEYNPFHHGHKIHLHNTRNLTGATHVVAVMSSSFLQRGEPALVDKWTRAEMAVRNGVDLVIELPFVYSSQTAELFAAGSTRILESTGVVDYLVFGSESGKVDKLKEMASILAWEPDSFRNSLREYLAEGNSFSASRSKALFDYYNSHNLETADIEDILKQSNNILAIEYLKSLEKLNSKIIPVTFNRSGDSYKERTIKSPIASATGIRHKAFNHGLPSARDYVPKDTYQLLEAFHSNQGQFNSLDNYDNILRYLLWIVPPEELKEYFDMETGLENRIKRLAERMASPMDLVSQISTKRYVETRIQRLLIHIMMGLKKEHIKMVYSQMPKYIRILSSNEKGFQILNKIKEKSDIAIVNKVGDSIKRLDNISRFMLEKEISATDLYFLGLRNPIKGMDFKTSPVIINQGTRG